MSDVSVPTPPPAGLPPVAPPSGRHIIQMFVAPALIVGVIVGGLVLWRWLLGGPASPTKILRLLDDANPEVRWRAAAELSQTLPRDPALAQDADFALEIVTRLRRSVDDNRDSEKVRKERLAASGEPPPLPKALRDERDLVQFLIACTGKFLIPVGAPVLVELTQDRSPADPEVVFRRRTQAVKALAELGSNLKRFDAQSAERRSQVLEALRAEAHREGDRGGWAADALRFLEARQAGKPSTALPVGPALVKTAQDSAPTLREYSAVALAYWDGDGVEDTLLRLTRDDGRGEDPIQFPTKEEAFRRDHADEARRINARNIAYNAAASLARRHSPLADSLTDLYAEMLDEKKQIEVAGSGAADLKESAEATAVRNILLTVHALDALHAARPEVKLPLDAINRLAESENKSLRSAALELRNKLK